MKNNPCKPEGQCLYPGLPKGSVGAVAELLVCADLLVRGFEVFRAVSSHCSCDLVAVRGSKMLRVEVRTGYKTKCGDISAQRPEEGRADLFAVVVGREIFYDPQLEPADAGK